MLLDIKMLLTVFLNLLLNIKDAKKENKFDKFNYDELKAEIEAEIEAELKKLRNGYNKPK